MLGIDHPWTESNVSEQFEVQLGKRLDAAVNRGTLKLCINNRGVRWGRIVVTDGVLAPLTKQDIKDLRLVSGDVLVCEGGEIGRASVWSDQLPEAYFLNTLHRLRSRRGYDPRLLVAFLERWAGSGALSALVGKSSLAHLTKENLLRLRLPAPPIAEQRRIAESVSSVDRLINTLECQIRKKQAIMQGILQQLLTCETRLPGFTATWRPTRLHDLGTTYGGLTGKTKEDFGHGSASYITFMEVMDGARLQGAQLAPVSVGASERQNRVERNDVLFNGSSETPEEVALAAAVDFDPSSSTYLNSFCFGYRIKRPDLIHPIFLAFLFRSSIGRSLVSVLAQGATRYNIAKTKLVDLAPALPPVDEQTAIVRVLLDAEDEIGALRGRLAKAKALKQGMVRELLTGRTRLPVAEGAL